MPILFLSIAIATALLIAATAVRFALHSASLGDGARGEAIPTAPVERIARSSLAAAAPLLVAAAVITGMEGVEAISARPGLRVLLSVVAVAGIVVSVLPLVIAGQRARRGTLMLDERNERILLAAPATQGWTLLLVSVASHILLSERFWDAGAVPVAWTAFALMSGLVAWAVALPLGILWRYRSL